MTFNERIQKVLEDNGYVMKTEQALEIAELVLIATADHLRENEPQATVTIAELDAARSNIFDYDEE